jgi:type II secretory pathway pseudopilin PulG
MRRTARSIAGGRALKEHGRGSCATGGAHRRDACATGAAGFTLIETLVAVGALAFVAVGIAVIFEATGKTISTGKRVSAFNAYAASIEKQLRADITAMTREGFLVIRHEYADADGNPTTEDKVPLHPGEGPSRRRARRTDELMFFAKGEFASARPPLVPGFVASADAARIYYGHGQRRQAPAAYSSTDTYYRPGVSDQPDQSTTGFNTTLGFDGNPDNPNRYASDWTLLRQVTLLAPPQMAARSVPSTGTYTFTAFEDTDLQVAMQPAASSIFRSLAAQVAFASGGEVHPMNGRPLSGSGIIDVATTDLAQVRSIAMTADVYPGSGLTVDFYDPSMNSRNDGSNVGVDGKFRTLSLDPQVLDRMQAWMNDALPSWSDAGAYTSPGGNVNQRCRVRYEPAPVDFAGVLQDGALSDTDGSREMARGDQIMLSSANFLPRCTEFIVEWSLGDRYPTDRNDPRYRDPEYEGEVIWHGMLRTAQQAGADGLIGQHEQANPYGRPPSGGGQNVWDRLSQPLTRNDGTAGPPHVYSQALFHGVNFSGAISGEPVTSFFGFVDPTYSPDANGNGKVTDPGDTTAATVPWPWPKMIRVTVSLADPADPAVERTFQFVFNVPQAGAN